MASFPRTEWVWKNGRFVPWEEATIHVLSHVVHYGSAVFEGIRCYPTPDGPAIFRLPEHVRRLLDSARIYRMVVPYTEAELARACCAAVERNGIEECYIRPIVLRGLGTPGLNPLDSPIETWIAVWPWGRYLGATALDEGVDVCVSSWWRPGPNTHPAMAKAGGNYLSSQLIKMEAVTNGFADAIALGPEGLVSEGPGQNLFLVRDGVLITPELDGTLLAGITRDSVLTLARDLGIAVREARVPRELLYVSDEAFFTGTAAEVTPIRSVDRITVGAGTVGPVTRRIQERLLGIAHGSIPNAYGWLTPVRAPARAPAQAPAHA